MPKSSQSPLFQQNPYSLHMKIRNTTLKNTSPNDYHPQRALSPLEIKQVKKTPIGKRLLNITKRIFNKKTLIAVLITGALLLELRARGFLRNSKPLSPGQLSPGQLENVRKGVEKTVTTTLSKNVEKNSKLITYIVPDIVPGIAIFKNEKQIKNDAKTIQEHGGFSVENESLGSTIRKLTEEAVTPESLAIVQDETIVRDEKTISSDQTEIKKQHELSKKQPGRIRRFAGRIGRGTKNIFKARPDTISDEPSTFNDNWNTHSRNAPKNSSGTITMGPRSHPLSNNNVHNILRQNPLESLADSPKKPKSRNN